MNCGTKTGMENFTIFTEFLLMQYSTIQELQVLHAVLFLLIYMAALMGNFLTITAIVIDPHLHSPLYFFLSNLSLLDIGYISVTLPKFIVNSLTHNPTISLHGCAVQIFFLIFFAGTEIALLVAMSYDRFVAICQPLHYGVIMTPARCICMATSSWLSGIFYSALHTGNMFRLPFSGSNVIHQYFCDIPHVLKVSCSEVRDIEYILLATSSTLILFCFGFLIISYTYIFSTVLKMPSVEGRYKALSTCSPQLIIFILFALSGIVTVLGPLSDTSPIQNLLISMTYSILPPFMNPIIYSLRNTKIKTALLKIIKIMFFPKKEVSGFKNIKL
ncbi:olfactory receptor 14I1-like [Monodelphis domestica]|uniref:olfactory receptor 14I1-like n=1 Tax=Monodelphis domestica TaxID=13616 RepID=UPI0024E1B344|nr:olfactory receptor 14I1-like [Monodelphis domestica]